MTDDAPTFRNRSRAYMKAITFIALNDNSGNGDPLDAIEGYVTTVLVSEVWKLSTRTVAKEVAHIRERHGLEVAR